MKKILALSLGVLATAAYAETKYETLDFRDEPDAMYDQQYQRQQQQQDQPYRVPAAMEGKRHMFEFNAESIMSAVFAFDKSKVEGSDADNNVRANIDLNYAYGFHRLMQGGMRLQYFNGIEGSVDSERFNIAVGAIMNNQEDFSNAAFGSIYLGMGNSQVFGANSARDDLRTATFAVGKRATLERWGIKHVTWSPEIAAKFVNSTTDEALDYSQSLEFRLLQFSVFF